MSLYPHLEAMGVADFEDGGLYVVAISGIHGKSHTVVRVVGDLLIEEGTEFPISHMEVVGGTRVEGFWDEAAIEQGDTVLCEVHERPREFETGTVVARLGDRVWVEFENGGGDAVVYVDRCERV